MTTRGDHAEVGVPAAEGTEQLANEAPRSATTTRSRDALLAEAIRTLTEAARLRLPVADQDSGADLTVRVVRSEPVDWAEFVTQAVTGAVANIGSVSKALSARPGSWEADSVRAMVGSTVGDDPAGLLRHRTEPLRVVLRPAEIFADLGYHAVYDESQRLLVEQQHRHVWRYQLGADRSWRPLDEDAPPCEHPVQQWSEPGGVLAVARSYQDEREYDRLLDLEARTEDLRYDDDPDAMGKRFVRPPSRQLPRCSPDSSPRSASTSACRSSLRVGPTISSGPRSSWSRPPPVRRRCRGAA